MGGYQIIIIMFLLDNWPIVHIVLHCCFGRKAVSYGDFCYLGYKQSFFCVQVRYCPVRRGNRTGSSRNEFDLPEGYNVRC